MTLFSINRNCFSSFFIPDDKKENGFAVGIMDSAMKIYLFKSLSFKSCNSSFETI